jgi:hypothetical protein
MLVYGIPVGSDRYVASMLDRKVEEVADSAAKSVQVLQGEPQALWTVLRLSIQQQFGYWLALVHPTQVAAAAARVDTILHSVLERVAGFPIPEGGQGLTYTCPLEVGVDGLDGRSFQSVLSSLPLKSGGLGLAWATEERMRREREVQCMGRLRGKAILMRGHIMLGNQ